MTRFQNSFYWKAIFFLSGCSSLIYQITFTKFFIPVMGLSLPAMTVVVSSFFSGMAIGSLLVPRLIKWNRCTPIFYALIEIAIGLLSVLVVYAKPLLFSLYRLYSDDIFASTYQVFFQFLLSFLFLLPSTLMMGLSFPICTELFSRKYKNNIKENKIGIAYFLHLLGASVGCFLCGFYLIENLGLKNTFFFTAGINILTAVLILFHFQKSKISLPQKSVISNDRSKKLLFFYFFLGVLVMSVEVVWFRLFVFYIGGAVYSFSIILTVILLGNAIGSYLFGEVFTKVFRRWRWKNYEIASLLTAKLALFILISFYFLTSIDFKLLGKLFPYSSDLVLSFVFSCFLVVPCTIFLGGIFAFLNRELEEGGLSMGESSGLLFAVNSFGSVVGTILTTFFLLDFLGLQKIVIYMSVGIFLLSFMLSYNSSVSIRRIKIVQFLFLVGVILLIPHNVIQSIFSKQLGELVFYKETARDIVAVHKFRQTEDLRLAFNDGRGTCGTIPQENEVARLLAHSSMAMNPRAKDILVISFGCGNTASAFAVHPIISLDIVDVSQSVREAAPFFWTNKNVINDARLKFYVEDGRNFLLRTKKKYDIIQLELPNLLMDGTVFLYTKEFYQLVRERLKDKGVISQWMNAAKTGRDASLSLVHTLANEFPNAILFERHWAWWVNATLNENQELFPSEGKLYFEDPKIRNDLLSIGSSYQDIHKFVLANRDEIEKFTKSSPLVTDDLTLVDFSASKFWSETIFHQRPQNKTPGFFK